MKKTSTLGIPKLFLLVKSLAANLDTRSLFIIGTWIAVMLVVTVISVGITFLKDVRFLVVIVGGIVGIGFVLYLLFKPSYGLAVLLIGGLIVPFEIGTGSQTSLNAAILALILVTGVWVLNMVVIKRKIVIIPTRTYIPLVLLLGVTVFSFIMGQLRWFPVNGAPIRAQIGGIAIFFLSALAFFIMANVVNTMGWLSKLTWLFLILGAIYLTETYTVSRLPLNLQNILSRFVPRSTGGSMLWVWIAAMGTSQLFFNRDVKKPVKVGLAVFLAAMFYVRFFLDRNWTSGWMPALAAAAVVLVIGAPLYTIGLGLLGGIITFLNSTFVQGQVMGGDNEYSLSTRLDAWRLLINMVKVNPITGFGPANYYWYSPLFHIAGYYVSFNSHNNYVDLIAQTGLLGLAFYGWFMIEVGLLAWKLKSQCTTGFMKAYVIGCLGGLAGTLVSGMFGDWVIPFVYNIGWSGFRVSMLPWLFLGGLVVVEQSLRKEM